MSVEDPAARGPTPEEAALRADAALAGLRGDEDGARRLLVHASARVRATALGALGRLEQATEADVVASLADPDPLLRRRACTVAIALPQVDLTPLLADDDPLVVEGAAWAMGERGTPGPGVVASLADVATAHRDALCREAAVAALGAIGHPAGLPAVLAATADKPAVRRRAVLALAPFDGPEVDAALERALSDHDWQVRQAAEDLLGEDRAG